jgi:hypothetical protein
MGLWGLSGVLQPPGPFQRLQSPGQQGPLSPAPGGLGPFNARTGPQGPAAGGLGNAPQGTTGSNQGPYCITSQGNIHPTPGPEIMHFCPGAINLHPNVPRPRGPSLLHVDFSTGPVDLAHMGPR